MSVRETAKLLGKDKSYLENRLRLLKMGIDVQEMVSFRKDTLPHARLIDQVVDQKSRSELIQATKEGAGRREIEQAINETKNAVAIVEAGDPNLLVEVDDELPAGLDVQLEPTTEAEAEKNTVTTVETQQSSDSDENTVSFRKDSQTEPLRTSDAEDEGVSATLHLLDEAARRLEGLHLTSEERERVLAALAAMEKSVANRE